MNVMKKAVLLAAFGFLATAAKAETVYQIVFATPTIPGVSIVGAVVDSGGKSSVKTASTDATGHARLIHTNVAPGKARAIVRGHIVLHGNTYAGVDQKKFTVLGGTLTVVSHNLLLKKK